MLKFFKPQNIITKIRWSIITKKFRSLGKGIKVHYNFNIIGPENISLGNNVFLGENVSLETYASYRNETTGILPTLIIGNDVTITKNSHISCMNKITIGAGCLFGQNTFITDNYHGNNSIKETFIMPVQRKLYCKGAVLIGNNVLTGRNVCIMPGISIGDGAIIGANAVVTHNIPSNCVAAGIPAKIIRFM